MQHMILISTLYFWNTSIPLGHAVYTYERSLKIVVMFTLIVNCTQYILYLQTSAIKQPKLGNMERVSSLYTS